MNTTQAEVLRTLLDQYVLEFDACGALNIIDSRKHSRVNVNHKLIYSWRVLTYEVKTIYDIGNGTMSDQILISSPTIHNIIDNMFQCTKETLRVVTKYVHFINYLFNMTLKTQPNCQLGTF